MKRSALLATIILLTLSLVALTWELRSVVVSLIVALAMAATLEPPVEWCVKHRWPRTLAVLVVYVTVLGVLLGLVSAFFLPMVRELDPLAQDLVAQYEGLYGRLLTSSGGGATWVARLPVPGQMADSLTTGQTISLLRGVLGVSGNVGGRIGPLLLAAVLAVYLMIDRTRFERVWLSLVPPERRSRTRTFWRELNADVGAYLRSEVLQTVLAGALLAGGYWLIGIEYPFLLALIAAVAWLVPLLGGVFALIPLLLIGWLSGPLAVLIGIIYTIAVLIFLEVVVERRVYRHQRYWGVVVVLLMMALGDVFGLLGLLVAPPIAVALQSVLNEMIDAPAVAGVHLGALEERLADIHRRVLDSGDAVSSRHANLVARLDGLVAEMKEESVVD